jgi:hypothetical protein
MKGKLHRSPAGLAFDAHVLLKVAMVSPSLSGPRDYRISWSHRF